MKHPSPTPAPGPLGLALIPLAVAAAILASAVLMPAPAEAACACRCVDGKPKAVCTRGTDIRPLCKSTFCPLATPKRRPLDVRKPPPQVKPGCETREVYNPDTGRHEWGQICP